MDCSDVRVRLLDYQQGRLDAGLRGEIRAHLDACVACSRADAAERALTEILEQRLPQYPASLALKRRLAAAWPASPGLHRSWWSRWQRSIVPAFAVAVLVLIALPVYYQRTTGTGTDAMVRESINDYVRLLSSPHPLEIESGGIHQRTSST